jgi:hypothetical protein
MYVWSCNQNSFKSMCGIGTKIVLIYFLELKPKVFHKSKETPNIGCYVCFFIKLAPKLIACHLEPMITFIGPKKIFEKKKNLLVASI